MSQIEPQNMSRIKNYQSNGCSGSQILIKNWVKLNQKYKSELNWKCWVKLNRNSGVKLENYDSNVCSVHWIKFDNWVKFNQKQQIKFNQKILVGSEMMSQMYVVVLKSNREF